MSSFLCPSKTPAFAGQALDHANIDLLLEQMGGEAVPERMQGDALVDPGRPSRGRGARLSWRVVRGLTRFCPGNNQPWGRAAFQ